MEFEIKKYLGDWFEIAKIPFKWEIGCSFSKANYSFDENNNIIVKNDCLDENANVKYSRYGKAKMTQIKNMLEIEFNDGFPADPVGKYIVLFTEIGRASCRERV